METLKRLDFPSKIEDPHEFLLLTPSFENAMERVRATRPFVEPNDGFVLQLQAYERERSMVVNSGS
jgi:hypothetical protein